MKIDFPIEQAVRKRTSVRNYAAQDIDAEKIEALKHFISTLNNPFGPEVLFHFLEPSEMEDQQKLGTYGVIKGAKRYIGATVKEGPLALEALGYEFETVILFLAHLNLGSCWLGGTFNREGFASAMDIGEGRIFPAIIPYGYEANKRHLTETVMRRIISADQRKSWNELFFSQDFHSTLAKEAAGDLEFSLEMIRLGPSASNKQPWRILFKNDMLHFYENQEPGYSTRFPYDIQRLDMGIAAAHFDLSVREKGIEGHFDFASEPILELPKNTLYCYSWIRD
ncbi:MAG: nitroreductase [Ruminococcaceae bacterium]|nr:nitroreductase [Oscillospiraceae bacterium]